MAEQQPLNDGHWAEALDRVHTMQIMLNELLADHPAIIAIEANSLIHQQLKSFNALYQILGAKACEVDNEQS